MPRASLADIAEVTRRRASFADIAEVMPADKPPSLAPPPMPKPRFDMQPESFVGAVGRALPSSFAAAPQQIADTERIAAETAAEFTPAVGVPKMIGGARKVYGGKVSEGLSDVIEGGGQSLAIPAMAAGIVTAPVAAAIGLGASAAAQQGTERGLRSLGVDPQKARLAGNLVGAVPLGGAARAVRGAVKGGRSTPKVDADAPAVVSAADNAPVRKTAALSDVAEVIPEGVAAPKDTAVSPVDASVKAPDISASRRQSQRGSISLKPGEKPATPPPPEPDDLMNYQRLGLSDEGYKVLQKRVGEFRDATGYEKPSTTFDQVRSKSDQVVNDLEAHLKVPSQEQILTDQGTALAGRRAITTLANESARISEQLRDQGLRPEAKAKLEGQLAIYRRDIQDLVGKVTRIRTKAGQDLAFWRIVAEEVKDPFDPANWVSRVDKMHGGDAPPEVKNKLLTLLDEGRAAQERNSGDPRAPEVLASKQKVATLMAEQDRMGVLETISYLVRGGLLTGPGGAARDVIGTGLNQAMEEAVRLPASIVDIALSMKTGKRTVSGTGTDFLRSMSAARTGLAKIPKTIKQGATDEQLSKFEVRERAPAKFIDNSKVGRAYFDLITKVYRTRGAIDLPAHEYALKRSLHSQARAEATNAAKSQKLSGGERARFERDFVNNYVNNPSETAMTQAAAAADFATFRNDTTAYRAIKNFKRPFGSVGQFTVDMILPFTKATTAIGYRVAEYAGGGMVEGVGRLGKAAIDRQLTPEQQKLASEAIGRGLIGPALVMTGYWLAQKGVLTGTIAEAEGSRERDTAVGRQPMSLRVGDQWLQIGGLAPAGNLLVLGATLQREGVRPLRDATKRPAEQIGAGARVVLEQPYFQGAEEFIDFLKNPARQSGRMASSKAGMAVPTIVGNVAQATDTMQRETPRGSVGAAVIGGVQSRIPGLRQALPPRLDVLGKPVQGGGPSAFSPFRQTTAKEVSDPIARELVAQQVSMTRTEKKDWESPDEHRRRVEVQGKAIQSALSRAIRSTAYQRLATEDQKRDFLKKQTDIGRDQVNNLTSGKRYQRMSPDQRMSELNRVAARIR